MARQFKAGLAVGAIAVLAWHAWPDTQLTAVTANVLALEGDDLSTVNNAPPAMPDAAPRHTQCVYTHIDTRLSILNEIALQGGITFHNVTTLRDEPVTAELYAVSLETGLRTVLSGYDAFIQYESAAPDTAPLTVWIYAVGEGRNLAPVASTATAVATPVAEAQRHLSDMNTAALQIAPDQESASND